MQKRADKGKRLGTRKLELIRQEFETFSGEERSVKVLDLMLGGLRWFARFSERQRRLIFEQAEYLKLPARETIFKQGDRGEKMYIILKGRVAVEKTEYGGLPLVVALLCDGAQFGELSLVDQKKLAKQSASEAMRG